MYHYTSGGRDGGSSARGPGLEVQEVDKLAIAGVQGVEEGARVIVHDADHFWGRILNLVTAVLHLAGYHTGLEDTPQELLVSETEISQSLTGPVAQAGDAQELNKLLVIELHLGLFAAEESVDGVANSLGLLFFFHCGTLFIRSRSL